MYPQNNFGAGAQWQFATVIVVIALSLGLGVLVSNSELFHPEIASAAAEGMAKKDDIAYQTDLLNLDTLRNAAQVEAERAKMALENEKEAARQLAGFRQGFYEAFNSGIFVLFIAISLSLVILAWGIATRLKLYALPLLQAGTQNRRQPSAAATQARERERKQRLDRLAFKHTRPFWPADGKKEEFSPKDLPWAN